MALTGTLLQTGGTAEVNVNNPCTVRPSAHFHFKGELCRVQSAFVHWRCRFVFYLVSKC